MLGDHVHAVASRQLSASQPSTNRDRERRLFLPVRDAEFMKNTRRNGNATSAKTSQLSTDIRFLLLLPRLVLNENKLFLMA